MGLLGFRVAIALLLLFGTHCTHSDPTVAAAAPAAAWLERAQHQIAEREYRASENGQGLQAPNRAHNLRTYFDPAGIRVHDRTATGSPELLGLSLAAVGRGDALSPVSRTADVVALETRIEIRRAGLVEWYVNSPAGLEQGFTLAERPRGDAPLVVELAVAGGRASFRGDSVILEAGAGRRLRYGNLSASDAARRVLPAHLELVDMRRLRIVVDDANAVYPVIIDPALTDAGATVLVSQQLQSGFGTSVAAAGDVDHDGYDDVIVGAAEYDAGQTDEGAAFIFRGSASGIGDGTPANAATVLESNQASTGSGDAAPRFGASVASAGDVNGDGYGDVVVGAPLYDADERGAAFVFLGSATGVASGGPTTGVRLLGVLSGNKTLSGAHLGASVASAGDVNGDGFDDLIAGAPLCTNGPGNGSQFQEGCAFVFRGSATGVVAQASARLESNLGDARLGQSVAGAGDVNGDGFDDAIVGAPNYPIDGFAGGGAAFVFRGGAAGISNGDPATAATRLQSDDVDSEFGASVAGAGDVNGDGRADVIVGAPQYEVDPQRHGAAFVFLGSASGIPHGGPATATTRLDSDVEGGEFGASVSGAGDLDGDQYADVIVGAPSYQRPFLIAWGASFAFHGSASGIASASANGAASIASADQFGGFGANFGTSVAAAGDVNGDGYGDVIAGADRYRSGGSPDGAAFVLLGSASGIPSGYGTPLPPDGQPPDSLGGSIQSHKGGALGSSVASAGDVNGDGFVDVLVGAPRYDAYGGVDSGAAFIFLGSASGIADGPPATELASSQVVSFDAPPFFGSAVAGAGDVNGDGYDDVMVGSPGWGYDDGGAVFLFHGSASGIFNGLSDTAATIFWAPPGSPMIGTVGTSFGSVGDVNGDGYDDVFVNAAGAVYGTYLYLGSASGIASADVSQSADVRFEAATGTVTGGAGAGDVNGDGYADLIVTAYGYDAAHANQTTAFAFLGSSTGVASAIPGAAATRLESLYYPGSLSPLPNANRGTGDVNGDGYDDLIVNGPSQGGSSAADAFVFYGSASGVADGAPGTAAAVFHDVTPAGGLDQNADGYGDVLVAGGSKTSLFRGSPSGIASGSPATVFPYAIGSSAGDVNADGNDDVIVGSGSGRGFAYVVLPEPAHTLALANGALLLALLVRRRRTSS